MKQLKHILTLGLVLLMTSCVISGEDTGCANGVKVYFPLSAETSAYINANQVKQIDLFVFDQQGTLVMTHSESFASLSPDFFMEIPLGIGTYNFVAWANMNDMFSVDPSGAAKLSEAMVLLENSGGTVTKPPHILLFGDMANAQVTGANDQIFSVIMHNDTYKINLNTEYLLTGTDQFSLSITDRNGKLKFDNSLAHSDELLYTATCQKPPSGQLFASFNMLRLYDNLMRPESFLTLKNESTGEVLYKVDLIKQLLELRNAGQTVDFDTVFEYTITLIFGVEITVNINGWDVPIQSDNDLENEF